MVNSTLRRCLGLPEAIYILLLSPAQPTDTGKRLVKSPKVHLIDPVLQRRSVDAKVGASNAP
jgi:hypothetical protein